MSKQITAKEYSEKISSSKSWACTLLLRMFKYGEKAPYVKKVEKIGNRYLVTLN